MTAHVLKTYARLYVDDLDQTLPLLTELNGAAPRLRFADGRLDLAAIGDVLVLAGPPEALAPYRETQATAIVDDLDAVRQVLSGHGAEVIRGPIEVPTGRNLTACHPGGAVIEYVEWHRELVERLLA